MRLNSKAIDTNNNTYWYAVYVKSRHEKKVSEALEYIGIENYVPIRKELKLWSDRKKWVETVVITCYVFVKINSKQRETVLAQDGVVGFVRTNRVDALIPEEQIDLLKAVLGDAEIEFELSNEKLDLGGRYEVLKGSLQGKIVELVEIKGKKKACVSLEGMQLLFDVDINNLIKSSK